MKHKLFTIVLVLLAAFALSVAVTAQEDMSSTAPVHTFVDGSVLEGNFSTVNRYDNGLSMSLHTTDLVPGDVYTVWWVIFNEPQNCSGGACGEDDIFVFENDELVTNEYGVAAMNMDGLEASQISIQYATGRLTDADGNADFAASVGLGEVPGIVVGPGLVDPDGAEVHLVVRTHGPKIEGAFFDQITSFAGGCDPQTMQPCQDVQFSVHLPA